MAHSSGVAGTIAGSTQRPGRAAGWMRQIAEVLSLSRVHATEWENEETPWHLRKEDPTDTPVFGCGTVHVESTRREGLLPSAVLCHSRKDLPVSDDELKKPFFQTTQSQVPSDSNRN